MGRWVHRACGGQAWGPGGNTDGHDVDDTPPTARMRETDGARATCRERTERSVSQDSEGWANARTSAG
eukprot:6876526-Prymnesium_polylepis.1